MLGTAKNALLVVVGIIFLGEASGDLLSTMGLLLSVLFDALLLMSRICFNAQPPPSGGHGDPGARLPDQPGRFRLVQPNKDDADRQRDGGRASGQEHVGMSAGSMRSDRQHRASVQRPE